LKLRQASSESFTKENSLRRKFSDERFHLRLSTFLLHFANSLCSLFLIFHQKWRRRKQPNSISIYEQVPLNNPLKSSKDEEMSKEVERSLHMQHEKSSKDEEEVDKERSAFQMTLIAAKVFSVSVASTITYAILVQSQDSVLDMELTFRWLTILVLWWASFSSLSSFASFIVTVNNPSAFNCTHTEVEEDVVPDPAATQRLDPVRPRKCHGSTAGAELGPAQPLGHPATADQRGPLRAPPQPISHGVRRPGHPHH